MTNFFIGEPISSENKDTSIDMKRVEECFKVDIDTLPKDLVQSTFQYESKFYPQKKYYLSQKMHLAKSKTLKNTSEKIIKFIGELASQQEYIGIWGLNSEKDKFFSLIRKKDEAKTAKKETPKALVEKQVPDIKIHRKSSDFQNKIDDDESISKWSQSQKKASFSEVKKTPNDAKEPKKESIEKPSGGLKTEAVDKQVNTQFNEKINDKKLKFEVPQELRKQTRIDIGKRVAFKSRSFFGYYNFHNFFNHFIILYERLKFMKSLTDPFGAYHFLKQILFLYLANVIDSEFFEDLLSCLLSDQTGVFLNLDKIFSNIVKEIPTHEIDQFVINLNRGLFRRTRSEGYSIETMEKGSEEHSVDDGSEMVFPSTRNEECWLFLKTCHKLSLLTFKGKANCKQSQIQSYINNNNLVNDHLLKFEYLLKDQMFVIHKIKSFYKQTTKQVGTHFILFSAERI